MIVVPMDQLSENVLTALIEEFVTRHGAIQGEDTPIERKVHQVRTMLKTGHASIIWDEESQSATIVTKDELKHWPGVDE